jgi:hypothetical protein
VNAETVARRSFWGWISIALVTMLVVSFLAACGSDDDDDNADSTTDTAASTTDTASGTTDTAASTTDTTTGSATEETGDGAGLEATASAAVDDAATMTGMDTEELGAIGSCFQENTTPDVVDDLRAGNTDMAQDVYRGCLEDQLPTEAVAMLDPMIESASECGVTSAEGLSDADVTAMESGDETVIQRVTSETIDCLSGEYGDFLN